MRLLLVDDEAGIREGLAALLRLRGHEVRTAAALSPALEMARRHPFDVVLTDWRLPDGIAAPLVALASCPVVAISGHPEEIEARPGLLRVLGKPVLPQQVCDLLASVGAAAVGAAGSGPAPLGTLPLDVREAVEGALAVIGGAATVVDDGVHVTLRAPWPGDHLLGACERFGGDLRILTPAATPTVEIRWYRDGRSDAQQVLIAPDAERPAMGDYAVDFHGWPADAELLRAHVEEAARLAAAGRRLQLLNVPRELFAAIGVSDRGAVLPMREPIGPRMPAVLKVLWS